MTKQAYLEMRLADAIAEEDDYDLMVMGRTQGQGCYCFVNGLVPVSYTHLDVYKRQFPDNAKRLTFF